MSIATTQATSATPPTAARHYATPAQIEHSGEHSWITRGSNFVVALSNVKSGTVLARGQQADEYMVLLVDAGATIEAGSERVEAKTESLTIVPPGATANAISAIDSHARCF